MPRRLAILVLCATACVPFRDEPPLEAPVALFEPRTIQEWVPRIESNTMQEEPAWTARLTPTAVEHLAHHAAPFAARLDLFEGQRVEVKLDPLPAPSLDSVAWAGISDEGAVVTLVHTRLEGRRYLLADVRNKDGELIRIRSAGDGDDVITTREAPPLVPECAVEAAHAVDAPERDLSSGESVVAADDGLVFDVLVLYTADVRTAEGSEIAIAARIDLALLETNLAYRESSIPARLRLAHRAEVDYAESGFLNPTLEHLRVRGDGRLDEIHDLRDQCGADLVVLLVEGGDACGLAYLMHTVSSGFDAWAFSVVRRDCATGYFSFAHELAHNQGCCHDTPNSSDCGAPYVHGWRFQTPFGERRTVMSYPPGTRIPRFSNPAVMYEGVSCGDAATADNARRIRETATIVANWRRSAMP